MFEGTTPVSIWPTRLECSVLRPSIAGDLQTTPCSLQRPPGPHLMVLWVKTATPKRALRPCAVIAELELLSTELSPHPLGARDKVLNKGNEIPCHYGASWVGVGAGKFANKAGKIHNNVSS